MRQSLPAHEGISPAEVPHARLPAPLTSPLFPSLPLTLLIERDGSRPRAGAVRPATPHPQYGDFPVPRLDSEPVAESTL